MPKEATVQELQQIIKQEYGEELSLEKVAQIARDITGYFDLLANIYHRTKINENNNDKNQTNN